MSGHSKWHNIRVKKMAGDARRGKVYTKYARLIEIAAREGGGDPSSNVRLRGFIETAKSESVPNANIERAMKKGTGELKGEAMQEVVYEAYGPGGTAFIIECLTDNKNRSLGNVKVILSKHAGRFAESGSVMWMFERKGLVNAETTDALHSQSKLEEIELGAIDQGADDCSLEDQFLRVTTPMERWAAMRDHLKSNGLNILSAGLAYIPRQRVPVSDAEIAKKIGYLIDALEEDDDVSEVHTNAQIQGAALTAS